MISPRCWRPTCAAAALWLIGGTTAAAEPLTAARDLPPPALLILQISEGQLSAFIERDVEQRTSVDEVILGTLVLGTSRTQGRIGCQVLPGESGACFLIGFRGTAVADCVGINGPARVYSRGTTNFAASCVVVLDERGFRRLEPHVVATTTTHPYAVESTAPGLRGRVVQRVAQRRLQRDGPLSERIAGQLAEQRIREAFAAAVDADVARLNAQLAAHRQLLEQLAARRSWSLQPRSAPGFLQLVVVPRGADLSNLAVLPPASWDAQWELRVPDRLIQQQAALWLLAAVDRLTRSDAPTGSALALALLRGLIYRGQPPLELANDGPWYILSRTWAASATVR